MAAIKIECLSRHELPGGSCPFCPPGPSSYTFSGLRLTFSATNIKYLERPLTIRYQGYSARIVDHRGTEVVVPLSRTKYTNMKDFKSGFAACVAGMSGSGASIVDVTVTPTTITVTVDGASDSAPLPGATNLGYTASPTNGTVTSDTGTDAVIPLVTTINAGLMSPGDKIKLNGIETGATADQTAAEVPVVDAGDFFVGTNVETVLQEIGAALDAIGSGVTNLSVTRNATTVTVISDTGTDAVLPAATAALAGVMLASDKAKLDGIEAGATADQTAAEVPITDAGGFFTATDVEDALQELAAQTFNVVYTPIAGNKGMFVATTGTGLTFANAAGVISIGVPVLAELFELILIGTDADTAGDDSLTVNITWNGDGSNPRGFNTSNNTIILPLVLPWNRGTVGIGGPTAALPFTQGTMDTPQVQIIDVGGVANSGYISLKIPALSSTFNPWGLRIKFF